ncbi:MAG: hypothetical protein JGK12_16815 [Microcoleus sp. PH2017_01_SCD_O_A]|jgi:hypothetical protein|uniref:hypothetical protein n=1 Tax=unclassified Microcoleus TaxID=2642155 RepID=UPI001D9639CD|nr:MULTISPECIES: hypothetical protein [unclassified Microcoleus]MCC3469536.1 hypothetical protein [Microcoleus sp. PH2017_06_SFM_O_A]MCC3503635.1 hypothetical protein [Microcoleus sp. PH2017_19_SFW_U_A]TAG04531.1 MAG: hypothetical protein EAZ45_07620 [Oscillatoriales cyanobacterium]MCC3425544.1 hypothetical protein [Microcoleus sp. PH2017_01_SCD_O_A]MCC3438035.1 hypothetical protein [Microcoleus sp. PH2017_05_CCC_O_A]
MKTIKSSLIILGSIGLLFLGACGKGDEASDTKITPTPPPAASKPVSSAPAAAPAGAKGAKGGQVVNAGAYHLEFVPEKQATGTHLDLYLQKGDKKEPVPDAKVSAQVQLPSGKQQTLALKYDPEGKHYAVVFPGKDPGQYPVKVNADIKGEKVDGRFTFTQ